MRFETFRQQLHGGLAKEMVWVLAGQSVTLLASVAATKALTSWLGRAQYGRFALGMTVPVLLSQVAYAPVIVAAFRYYSAYREAGQLSSLMMVLLPLMRRLTLALFGVGSLVILVVTVVVDVRWGLLLFAALVFGLLQGVQGLFNSLQVAARRRSAAALHQAMVPLSRLVGGAGAVLLLGPTAEVTMAGVAVGMAAVLWSEWRGVERSVPAPPAKAEDTAAIRQTLWRYGRYFVVWGIFTSAQLASDTWALKLFHGYDAVGLYAAAFQMASVPSVVMAGAIAQFVTPIAFARAGLGVDTGRLAASASVTRLGVAAMSIWIAVSALVAIPLGEGLLVMFTAEAYRSAGRLLPLLILGLGLMQLGHLWGLIPMAYNRLQVHLGLKIAHSVLAVLLNVLGAWLGGTIGVSVSGVVSGAAYLAALWWNGRRITREAQADLATASAAP